MRLIALSLLVAPLLTGQTATPELRKMLGKDLQSVPGPFVDRYCQSPGYQDPAADPSNSPIQMQIRDGARRGPSIPAVALPEGPLTVSDTIGSIAGWKAYRVEVPPGAKVHVRLHSNHEAWFLVRTVNKMGSLEEGMLRNLIPTGNPEATYTNPKKEPNTIFFVVDTTEMDVGSEPFTLRVDWPAAPKP